MYLNHLLVEEAFKRLRSNASNGAQGKTPMERTSSLLIALAADATSKRFGVEILDINFSDHSANEVRKSFILEYTKLVTISQSATGQRQSVHEFGYVFPSGKSPESRLSSNFLTTHMVKAVTAEIPFEYPRRPAPLLLLGKRATQIAHGICLHPNWQVGMAKHLANVTSNTPYTDLAIFCLRATHATPEATLPETLCRMLGERFSLKMASFWSEKIMAERVFAKHIKSQKFMEATFFDSLAAMNMNKLSTRREELQKYSKEQLIEMIIHANDPTQK